MAAMTATGVDRAKLLGSLVPLALLVASGCSPPPRPRCDPDPPPGVLGSVCGFDRPEDILVFPEANLLLTSGMGEGVGLFAAEIDDLTSPDPRPWRIWPDGDEDAAAMGPAGDPACTAPPDPALFYSHGLGDAPPRLRGPRRIAVVNHGGREAVELFDLVGAGRDARLRWRGCVELPSDLLGNDVDIAPDGTIVVTNMVPRASGLLFRFYLIASSVGVETGRVLTWRRDRGWESVPGSGGAGPNGLTLSPDGRSVFFSDNGHQRIVRLPLAGVQEDGAPDFADLGSNPDNVTWTQGDTLLAIVHTGGAETLFQECLLDWALVEIDPESLEARELMRHGGETLCGATSAWRVGERIYIGTMSEPRLGVWREP